jgi:hypothetical protein
MLKAARAADPSIVLTSHGFRSTFKDWASECTNHSGEVSEAALAGIIKERHGSGPPAHQARGASCVVDEGMGGLLRHFAEVSMS